MNVVRMVGNRLRLFAEALINFEMGIKGISGWVPKELQQKRGVQDTGKILPSRELIRERKSSYQHRRMLECRGEQEPDAFLSLREYLVACGPGMHMR